MIAYLIFVLVLCLAFAFGDRIVPRPLRAPILRMFTMLSEAINRVLR